MFYVDMRDRDFDLSDIYVDMRDRDVDLSDIKNKMERCPEMTLANQN